MFENKIIRLRKLSPHDYPTYHAWRNNTEVMASTSLYLDSYTLEDTEQYVSMMTSQSNAKAYMIEHKETNQVIGIVSLINIDFKNRSAECIIDIGVKDFWGKGIGFDALALMLDFAFQELNLHRIFLQVFAFNKRAIALYKKLGFTSEGRLRQALYRAGSWHDIVIMSILKEEYRLH